MKIRKKSENRLHPKPINRNDINNNFTKYL